MRQVSVSHNGMGQERWRIILILATGYAHTYQVYRFLGMSPEYASMMASQKLFMRQAKWLSAVADSNFSKPGEWANVCTLSISIAHTPMLSRIFQASRREDGYTLLDRDQ